MERLKAIAKKIFCLPPLLTALIAIPSFALVFGVLGSGQHDSPLAYLSYPLSAYALVICITGFPGTVRAVRERIPNHPLVKKLLSTALGRRFWNDALFRTELSLYQSTLLNLCYAAVKLVSGILFRSVWLAALGVYYLLLSLTRSFLVRYVRKTPARQDVPAELRCCRQCGVSLLVLNGALAVLVGFIVYQNQGFVYPGMLIYVMALYTFYATITAAIHVVKFRRRGSPVLSAAKVINLTSALVSMLALTTAMISQFGDTPGFRLVMTASVGGGVCLIVLGMAVYMLLRCSRELRRLAPISKTNH